MKKIFFNIKSLEKKINIAFFTSNGGVSKNNFFSLNCSESSGDNKKFVRKNINIALQEIKINNKKLKLINQVHSNKVFFVNKKNYKKNIDGDGLITDKKDLALGILTADCAPIFIFDINKKIICNLHSGWKSAFLNIVKQSIKKIKSKKILTKNLIAVVGPCLEYNKFEVDKNFKYKFIKKNQLYSQFFKYKNKDKDLFNLRKLLNFQLKLEGVKKIYNIKKDTYKNDHIFFSHRRATHENKIRTGRMINIISFRD